MPTDLRKEFAGEIEAIVSDIGKMKTEAADAKEKDLLPQIDQLRSQYETAFDEGRKAGAGEMIAILKSDLGIF